MTDSTAVVRGAAICITGLFVIFHRALVARMLTAPDNTDQQTDAQLQAKS
jgi:hypothetical protein